MRRWTFATLALAILVAQTPASATHYEDCAAASEAGAVRVKFARVILHDEGAGQFEINPRFACADVYFRFQGSYPSHLAPDVVPVSTASLHQSIERDGVVEETWVTITFSSTTPLVDFHSGTSPWFPGASIDYAWNVTGVGEIEFYYVGYL